MERQGAVVTKIDLEALNLPLYNPNDETDNFPGNAKTLKQMLVDSGTL